MIGDAAHVTIPCVGVGVNMAMKDYIVLAPRLREFGTLKKSVEEYEKDVLPKSKEVIEMSIKSVKLYYE